MSSNNSRSATAIRRATNLSLRCATSTFAALFNTIAYGVDLRHKEGDADAVRDSTQRLCQMFEQLELIDAEESTKWTPRVRTLIVESNARHDNLPGVTVCNRQYSTYHEAAYAWLHTLIATVSLVELLPGEKRDDRSRWSPATWQRVVDRVGKMKCIEIETFTAQIERESGFAIADLSKSRSSSGNTGRPSMIERDLGWLEEFEAGAFSSVGDFAKLIGKNRSTVQKALDRARQHEFENQPGKKTPQ